ncbi:MAG: DUF3579 domain-containing protein [Vitreoscilla sp.]|nr:DUF3579 domain-containing protein [Burkholderiales bacterium]MBP6336551.1 DUF3579 domain-containing protein [Vitreoscilla sp.]MBP6673772.1 DUF3579 domain-containing protein [Vitreoscilla sp.]
MSAAAQQAQGTIRLQAQAPILRAGLTASCQPVQVRCTLLPDPASISVTKPREVFIQGLTKEGRAFRPSDWAERLAGALSSFRPGGPRPGLAAHISYSPYCVPRVINGVKCVIVNEALRDLEPMAWDFVMSFARDNELQVTEACLLPERVGKV